MVNERRATSGERTRRRSTREEDPANMSAADLLQVLVERMDRPSPTGSKPPASLRLTTPRRYDGEAQHLKSFERSFRTYARLSIKSERTAKEVLATFLSDPVARWYEQLAGREEMSLDEIFDEMKKRYCPPPDRTSCTSRSDGIKNGREPEYRRPY
jgi:hypothetical protein